MCKEIEDELARGDEAARLLATHLLAMGAGTFEQVIAVDGALVKVSAQVVAKECDRDDTL